VSTVQQPKVHRFNLTQYYELGELGLLDRRTELLEGFTCGRTPYLSLLRFGETTSFQRLCFH
jgi:hypothetical protein